MEKEYTNKLERIEDAACILLDKGAKDQEIKKVVSAFAIILDLFINSYDFAILVVRIEKRLNR